MINLKEKIKSTLPALTNTIENLNLNPFRSTNLSISADEPELEQANSRVPQHRQQRLPANTQFEMNVNERAVGDESENELLLGDSPNHHHHQHQHHHQHNTNNRLSHVSDNRRNEDDDDECIVRHDANSSVESKTDRTKQANANHRHRHGYLKERIEAQRLSRSHQASNRNDNDFENHEEALPKSSDSSTNSILVDIGLVSDLDTTSPLITFDNTESSVHEQHEENSAHSHRPPKRHSFIRPDTDANETDEGHSHHHHHHHHNHSQHRHVRLPNRMNHHHGLANPGFNPDERVNSVSSATGDSYHCHLPKNDPSYHKQKNSVVFRKLITVLIMCIFFMVAEIVGGILAGSISIQTDAAHMAADIAGFALSILALHLSSKNPSMRMTFGYYRSEVLGALASTLIIWVVTAVLVYLAVQRVITHDYEIEPLAMVVTASCGVFFNIVMYFVLHTNKCFNGVQLSHHGHSHSGGSHGHSHGGHGHSHGGHGHSHGGSRGHGHSHKNSNMKCESTSSHSHFDNTTSINTNEVLPITDSYSYDNPHHSGNQVIVVTGAEESSLIPSDDSSNINLRAATIHVIGDFIQSVGVLVAALIIKFEPSYKIADPICTFIFSALVMTTTAPILRDIFFVLMEASPASVKYVEMINDLYKLESVRKVHSLHVWCLTMDKFSLTVHLATNPDSDSQKVLREANELLRSKYNIDRTTIQIETYDTIMDSCNQCQLPSA